MSTRWLAALAMVAALATGCDDGDDGCSGARIDPFPTTLAFGDFLEAEGDLPARRVVLLKNGCGATLEISEVCIIEDGHNGDPDDPAFELEPPDRTSVKAGEDAAIRVTYSPSAVNEDQDQDAARDLDAALLVVQSNATDRPTLVVPLCGRLIAAGETPERLPCAEAFTIPGGERIADLCSR